ncbi:MAG: hypothetical protein LBT58_00975 [Endomicrobium sp.]|nr:hypothetical protein [Endomicrobium sp.]
MQGNLKRCDNLGNKRAYTKLEVELMLWIKRHKWLILATIVMTIAYVLGKIDF